MKDLAENNLTLIIPLNNVFTRLLSSAIGYDKFLFFIKLSRFLCFWEIMYCQSKKKKGMKIMFSLKEPRAISKVHLKLKPTGNI